MTARKPIKRLARQSDREHAKRLALAFLNLPPDRGDRKDGSLLARELMRFALNGTFDSEFDPGRPADVAANMRRLYWQLWRANVPELEAVRQCAQAAECDMRTARKVLKRIRARLKASKEIPANPS